MRVLIITFLMLIFATVKSVAGIDMLPQTLPGMLDALDYVIENQEEYKKQKNQKIDSIKLELFCHCDSLPLYRQLIDEYACFQIDSAIHYSREGQRLALQRRDASYYNIFTAILSSMLPLKGVVKEAIDMYDSVDVTKINEKEKSVYFETGNRLYFGVSVFYPEKDMRHKYMMKGISSTDSLLKYLPSNSLKYKLYNAQMLYVGGDRTMMKAELNDVLRLASIDDNLFARAASIMSASIMEKSADNDEALFYLAMAAVADCMASTLEGTALQRVGVQMYERGEMMRAYLYLTTSLNDAVVSGANVRTMQTSHILPIISKAYRDQDHNKLVWLMWLIVALVVALGVILYIIMFLRKEIKYKDEMRMTLSEANAVKETYISHYLNLCSIYLDKQIEFQKLASRKISAGQIDDLYNQIKSGKLLGEQTKMFYDVFDDAFVHIYPTFVDDVNNLMNDDAKIVVADGLKLNTELRILAFMRLGVDDSSRIAKFLGLSLNTIYTYRNKLKGRAKNRETFESEIMKIGKIQ